MLVTLPIRLRMITQHQRTLPMRTRRVLQQHQRQVQQPLSRIHTRIVTHVIPNILDPPERHRRMTRHHTINRTVHLRITLLVAHGCTVHQTPTPRSRTPHPASLQPRPHKHPTRLNRRLRQANPTQQHRRLLNIPTIKSLLGQPRQPRTPLRDHTARRVRRVRRVQSNVLLRFATTRTTTGTTGAHRPALSSPPDPPTTPTCPSP